MASHNNNTSSGAQAALNDSDLSFANFPPGFIQGRSDVPEDAATMAALLLQDPDCSEVAIMTFPLNPPAYNEASQQSGVTVMDVVGFAMRPEQPELADAATQAQVGSETSSSQALLDRLRREVEDARRARIQARRAARAAPGNHRLQQASAAAKRTQRMAQAALGAAQALARDRGSA